MADKISIGYQEFDEVILNRLFKSDRSHVVL